MGMEPAALLGKKSMEKVKCGAGWELLNGGSADLSKTKFVESFPIVDLKQYWSTRSCGTKPTSYSNRPKRLTVMLRVGG